MEQGKSAGRGPWLLGSLVLLPLLPSLLSPLWPELALRGHDLFFTFGPKFEFAARHFPALPTWHPEIYCGHPFTANPQAMAFYPPSWLLHALGWSLPLASWWAAGHVLLAAFLFRALALELGASAAGAELGALAWALGGQGMGRLFAGHLSWTAAMPWIPLLFLGLRRCAARRGRTGAAQAGLAAGLLALCGAPQAAGLALLAGFLWIVYLLGRGVRREGLRALRAGACLALALLPALPLLLAQALPTLPFLGRVAEAGRMEPAHAASGSMQPAFLATLLAPGHFGPAVMMGGFSWEQAGYIGAAGLLLALLALAARPARETLFPGALLGLAVLAALGPATPLFDLMHGLPLLGAFRTPGRAMLLATLALAWLASLGLPRPDQGAAPRRRLWPPLAILLAASLALLAAPGLCGGLRTPGAALSRLFGLLVLLAAGLLLLRRGRGSPGRALLLLQALDLFVLLGPFSLFPPTPPPGDRRALERGLEALPGGPERSWYRVDHPDLGPLGLFPELGRRGIRSTRGCYDPGVDRRYRRWLDGLDALRAAGLPVEHALDLMAVRFLFAAAPGADGLRSTCLAEDMYLVERNNPPPRFRFVGEGRAVDAEEAWWRLLLDPAGRPPDPRRSVTLSTAEEPAPIVSPGAAGAVRLLCDEPGRIELEVTASGPGYLVASELLLPGWSASLGGAPARLLRADLLFQAVRLEKAGTFRVALRHRPPGAGASRALVLLGLALGLGLAVQRQGSKSARPSSPARDMPARS